MFSFVSNSPPARLGIRKSALVAVALLPTPISAANGRPAIVTALTGELGSILLVAVPLAFLLAVGLLAIYLRAVKRSMLHRTGAAGTPASDSRAPGPPPGVKLEIADVSDAPPHPVATRAEAALRRAVLVYAVAGIVSAFAMAVIYLTANATALLPFRTAFVTAIFAWPLVLTIGLVALTSWRGWLIAIAIYGLIVALILWPVFDARFTPASALLAWSIHAVPATIMVLVFLARRIRAVGPMVMAFTFAAVAGMSVAVNLVGASDDRIRAVADLAGRLGLGGHQAFFAVMLAGMVVLGIVGWLALRVLGWLYRTRRVSDQTLMIDSIWLMFTLHHAIGLAFAGPHWFPAAFVAFLIYKIVACAGFALVRPGDDADKAPRLLLLRVFSLGKRSERLFDAFAKRWRHAGTVRMIAGPDLARSTVEPHEFLDFLSGRLARRFIDGPTTLDRRLAESEARRDADGRFRVTDFFCHDDTWKMVLHRLAAESDGVLMDLRGFTRANKGCAFEIHALLDAVPLSRFVLVLDATTDEAFLRETLAAGWSALAAASPGRADPRPAVRVFRLEGGAGVPGLVRAVATATQR